MGITRNEISVTRQANACILPRGPHRKNWRSFAQLKRHICRSRKRWICCVFHAPRFIAPLTHAVHVLPVNGYDLYLEGGLDGLADRSPCPGLVWNRIPEATRNDVIECALEHEALTPRELAVKYTDEKRYFISESSVYRILKAADLITAPSHVTIKAASEFHDKTTRINEMWQTDFTYFKIIGLSGSRYA